MVVVICLMGIMLIPLASTLEMGYRHLITLSRQADAKTECQRASERVFHWLSQHPKYQIDPDNHGLHASDASITWRDQKLELRERGRVLSLLEWPVSDFSVIPRPGGLTLNLAVDVVIDSRRPVLHMHELYDYPRVGSW